MNKPISVGDLVYVARPCPHCGSTYELGITFRVGSLWESGAPADCCRDTTFELCASVHFRQYPGYPVVRLSRIPPLDELEGEKQKEDIREPA